MIARMCSCANVTAAAVVASADGIAMVARGAVATGSDRRTGSG